MKLKASASTFLLFLALVAFSSSAAAQNETALRAVGFMPYDKAAPGQIAELRVEGLGTRFTALPPLGELQILISQDGTTHTAAARTATPTMIREARAGADAKVGAAAMDADVEMKSYHGVTFVVPRVLHEGEAEVVLQYRKRQSNAVKLNILARPPSPTVGGTVITTIAPMSLPAPPKRGAPIGNPGLRFERGAKAELHIRPLVDPEDESSAVLVRFKQGSAFHEANARVRHREAKTESINGGVRFSPPRDVLEIVVPELLALGDAEIEVRLRAGGQTGDAVLLPVVITDATRAVETPKETAPRLLSVAPRRVGAGQAVMLSIDHRRTLDPDPSKTLIVVEQNGVRQTLRPEMNSAVRNPDTPPDAPVLLIARLDQPIVGAARISVVNPSRAEEQGGMSEAKDLEIVAEVLPPEVLGVNESTKAELAPLRQMYEAQTKAGRKFGEYDPDSRYVTIRARGIDYNPRFVRIRMEQEGRTPSTLSFADFAHLSGDTLIVRAPKDLSAGTVQITIENSGAGRYSTPVVRTFEWSGRQ